MKVENLRSLIRESINEYIREIDNAGTKAGLEAKIAATEGAIEKREKMANMEGIDEAYHEMLDKGKMKEINNEVKALKKSLTRLQNQLSKLNSKSEPKSEVIKDEAIEEDNMPRAQKLRSSGTDDNWNDDWRGFSQNSAWLEDGNLEEEKLTGDEFGGNKIPKRSKDADSEAFYEKKKALKRKMKDADSEAFYEKGEMNESFLKMQKLAGVITENQYNTKIEELDNNIAPEEKEDKNVSTLISRLQQLKPQLKANDTPAELKKLISELIELIQGINNSQLTDQESIIALTQLISDKRKAMADAIKK